MSLDLSVTCQKEQLLTTSAARSVGGLGLQDPFNERHVQSIVHVIKILSASDPLIKNISKGQLTSVVYRCFHRTLSDDEVDAFLCGSLDGEMSNHSASNNSQTLWSRCRISSCALKVKIKSARVNVSISIDNFQSAADHKSVAYLHQHCLKKHADLLKNLPDPGKRLGVSKKITSLLFIVGVMTVPVCGSVIGDLSIGQERTHCQPMMLKVDGKGTLALHVGGVIAILKQKLCLTSSAIVAPIWSRSQLDIIRFWTDL